MGTIDEQVKELKSRAFAYGIMGDSTGKLMSDAADTIKSLYTKLKAAHDGGGWTLCSEKLPEAGEFYIVTYRFEDETFLKCHELYYGTADGETEPGWYLDDDGQELYKPFEVTAWQPLPEPYSPQ